MKIKIIAISITLLSTFLISGEKNLKSLEKSIIFPGWGQISEKRYFEGILFASSELFCIGLIFKNLKEGNNYYELYRKAETTEDAIKYRELTIKFDKRRNKFIAGAIAVWALNLVDMYLIWKKKENLVLKFGGDSFEIGFKKEF